MFVYVCCGSILNSVSCLLVASRVLLDSVVTSYAKLVLRISGVSTAFRHVQIVCLLDLFKQ